MRDIETKGADPDDPQGKHRGFAARRTALLTLAFVLGLTLGVVVAQRLYVEVNRPPAPGTTQRQQKQQHQALLKGADGAPAALDVPPAVGVVPAAARPGCAAVRGDCALEAFLQRVAPGGEVLVAISNFHLIQHGGMLNTWIENVQRSKTGPWMVLAIDSDLHEHLDQRGIPNYYIKQEIAAVQQGTGNNHAVSALKFGVLAEFLKLGWAVLLSDVDVVTLSDPFAHLYRDRDVEGMTDGFDDAGAYGFIDGLDDPSMGWARYAQAVKHMNLNSGLFYVRANRNTVALMERLAERLAREKYWDQTAFNEEIFFLSHGAVARVPVSVRVMDYWLFQNSKVFFKQWRHQDEHARVRPIMVHINYHPNKEDRMRSIVQYFVHGDGAQMMAWPGGSEPGT